MKKILILILGLTLSLNSAVISKTSVKTATGEGHGLTYEQAVDNALAEAIGKLNGAYIKSAHESKTFASNRNGDVNYVENYNKKISRATQGRFNSFEVLSKDETPSGFKVVVQIKKINSSKYYKIPGQNTNKHNIVVVPRFSNINVKNTAYQEYMFLNILKTNIQNEIYKARKFNLLDRDNDKSIKAEEHFIKNNASKDEALRIGKYLGADYLLLFDISSITYNEGKFSSMTNTTSAASLNASINYQVILLATKEIKYSNTITKSFLVASALSEKQINDFMSELAKEMVNNFHSGIYPPIVENISDNLAIFTQKLPLNTELDCFSKGKIITDSRTKEKSFTQDFSGTVEVIRNNEKQSYAKIIIGNVKKGDICSIKKAKKKSFNGYGSK